MSEGTCPHDVGARVVVLRVFHYARCRIHDGANQAAGDVIGNGDRGLAGEEPLHDVRAHVRDARCGLVGRQGESEFGVHERHDGAVEIGVAAAFKVLGIVADDTGIGGLGARCGEGEHTGDVYALCRRGALAEEIPDIAVVGDAQGNGLGAVDGAAAAYRQNQVDVCLACDAQALANRGNLGVGAYAAELHVCDARGVE